MAESKLIPEQERPGFLMPAFLNRLEPLDPVRWLPSLKGRFLKVDDAVYERETPPEAKVRMDAVLPSGALLLRYPTQNDFEKNAMEGGRLMRWLDETLQKQPTKDAQLSSSASPQLAGFGAQAVTR